MKIQNLEDSFIEKFSNRIPVEQSDNMTIGVPVFTEESIGESRNQLDVILRTFMVKKGITIDYLTDCFRMYAQNLQGIHPGNIKNRRTNLIKALKRGNITFNRFKEALCEVLGYTLVDIQFTFDGPTGREVCNLVSRNKENK